MANFFYRVIGVQMLGWGSPLTGSRVGQVAEGSKTKSGIPGSGAPGHRTQLIVQSGHCKLKLNGLVSEQYFL